MHTLKPLTPFPPEPKQTRSSLLRVNSASPRSSLQSSTNDKRLEELIDVSVDDRNNASTDVNASSSVLQTNNETEHFLTTKVSLFAFTFAELSESIELQKTVTVKAPKPRKSVPKPMKPITQNKQMKQTKQMKQMKQTQQMQQSQSQSQPQPQPMKTQKSGIFTTPHSKSAFDLTRKSDANPQQKQTKRNTIFSKDFTEENLKPRELSPIPQLISSHEKKVFRNKASTLSSIEMQRIMKTKSQNEIQREDIQKQEKETDSNNNNNTIQSIQSSEKQSEDKQIELRLRIEELEKKLSDEKRNANKTKNRRRSKKLRSSSSSSSSSSASSSSTNSSISTSASSSSEHEHLKDRKHKHMRTRKRKSKPEREMLSKRINDLEKAILSLKETNPFQYTLPMNSFMVPPEQFQMFSPGHNYISQMQQTPVLSQIHQPKIKPSTNQKTNKFRTIQVAESHKPSTQQSPKSPQPNVSTLAEKQTVIKQLPILSEDELHSEKPEKQDENKQSILNNQLDQSKAEIEVQKTLIEEQKREIEDLKEKNSRLEHTNETLKTEIEKAKKEAKESLDNNPKDERITFLEKDVHDYKEKLETSQQKVLQLTDTVETLQINIAKFEKANRLRNQQEAQYQTAINQHGKQISQKNDELARARNETEALRIELYELRFKSEQDQEKLRSLTLRNSALQNSQQTTQQKIGFSPSQPQLSSTIVIAETSQDGLSNQTKPTATTTNTTLTSSSLNFNPSTESSIENAFAEVLSSTKEIEPSTPLRSTQHSQPSTAQTIPNFHLFDIDKLEHTLTQLNQEKMNIDNALFKQPTTRSRAELEQRIQNEQKLAHIEKQIQQIRLTLRSKRTPLR